MYPEDQHTEKWTCLAHSVKSLFSNRKCFFPVYEVRGANTGFHGPWFLTPQGMGFPKMWFSIPEDDLKVTDGSSTPWSWWMSESLERTSKKGVVA